MRGPSGQLASTSASRGRSRGSWARSHSSGRCTSGSSKPRSARPSSARVAPRARRSGAAGGDRPEQAPVEVAERVHHAPGQRAVRDHGPRCPAGGRQHPRHRQPWCGRLDVPQHPDLDVDHRRVGAQVRELHDVTLVTARIEEEVVVGLAGQPGELAGQAEAGPDGFGGLGRGDRLGGCQPGHVQVRRQHPGHGQPGRGRLDVPQHPDLDVDHRRVGAQVRELHHVTLLAARIEEEVVVGLAGEPGKLAGQGEAGPDGFGGRGRGDRLGGCQPGHVQVGVWGHAVPFGRAGNPARSDQII